MKLAIRFPKLSLIQRASITKVRRTRALLKYYSRITTSTHRIDALSRFFSVLHRPSTLVTNFGNKPQIKMCLLTIGQSDSARIHLLYQKYLIKRKISKKTFKESKREIISQKPKQSKRKINHRLWWLIGNRKRSEAVSVGSSGLFSFENIQNPVYQRSEWRFTRQRASSLEWALFSHLQTMY